LCLVDQRDSRRSPNYNGMARPSMTHSLRSDAGHLDHKTDHIAVGRAWTALDDAASITADSRGNLDVLGRLWTLRRALQNRRVQVRFLSHLPHIP
jgi:hypothetical protein